MQKPHIVLGQPIEQIPPMNLLIPPTLLIGREREVEAAQHLLRQPDVRLLTIVGTAGIGKTRVSVQVALSLIDDFVGGVSFIPLAPITDCTLVIPAIVQALGLGDVGEQSEFDLLKLYLQNKQFLLLLDNFEQVISAAPQVAELLAACPELKIVITSREVLRIRSEHQFPLRPLALPDVKRLPDTESLSQYAAVRLFVQRAHTVRPTFTLTDANAATIATICARLDGLPLAIELAAARIRLLSPQALLARMNRRLQMLTHGPRDLPERQQTLRNTIQWSYDLLNAEEQRLFRWFSVFVGGCTLMSVQGVCGSTIDGSDDVLNGVMSLLDKSLIQQLHQGDDETRLVMLETIREYGLECLEANGETETVQRAYVDYYVSLVEEAEPELRGVQQAAWLERLEQEHENLRTVLHLLLERQVAQDSVELALRCSSALWWFWYVHGHFSEGRRWLERALANSEGVSASIQAKALHAAGLLALYQERSSEAEMLCQQSLAFYQELRDTRNSAICLRSLGMVAWVQGKYVEAWSLVEKGLTILREMGDRFYTASSLIILANVALTQGEYDKARTLTEEGLAIHRELGNTWYTSYALNLLAQIGMNQGDYTRVRILLEESLVLSRQVGYKVGRAYALDLLAKMFLHQGETAEARSLAEEGLLLFREMGEREGTVNALTFLAYVAASQGDVTAARMLAEESMSLATVMGDKTLIAASLTGFGNVAATQGQYASAVRIWGAAQTLRDEVQVPLPPIDRAFYEPVVATAQTQLGEKSFAALWAEGRMMTPGQALAAQELALLPDDVPTSASSKKSSNHSTALTLREVEVLRLVAVGLTNVQIADHLVISTRTVNAHLRSIYHKLGLTSRIAIVRYAIDKRLV